MAGWITFPLAENGNWTSVSGPWAELYAAWNERRATLGQSAATAPVENDIIADKDWIEDIQSWIESNCSQFYIPSTVSYAGQSKAYSPTPWSISTLKSAVLPHGDWWRKNESGGSTGKQAENYYASFIDLMNDLRLVLDQLTHRPASVSYSANAGLGGGSDYLSTWSAAIASAIANSHSSTAGDCGEITRGHLLNADPTYFAAFSSREDTYNASFTGSIGGTVSMYVCCELGKTHGYEDTYSSNAPSNQDEYASLGSQFVSAGNQMSRILGSTSNGIWPDAPTISLLIRTVSWEIYNVAAVVNHAVSGGFTYY